MGLTVVSLLLVVFERILIISKVTNSLILKMGDEFIFKKSIIRNAFTKRRKMGNTNW